MNLLVGLWRIEWHAWVTTLEEVSSIVAPSGFALENVGPEDSGAGIALFRRRS